jgi:ankyrin repeat protein
MDFFGFGNRTGRGWFDFIKEIPGLQGKRKIYISNGDDGNEDSDSNSDEKFDYKTFNITYLKENGVNISSVAKYRGMLLIECCQIMKDNFNDLGNCKDGNGNTPLHFIAALPGLTCSTLVKYLLQAGVDPLATNKDGHNFLRIILGRCKAKGHTGALCFSNDVSTREHVPATKWFVEDRVELLDLLAEELSQAQTSLLVKARDTNGNTVMHEFALASPIEEENFDEVQICQKLLKFGASLRVPTNFGNLPLHYALNPSVYDVLNWEGRLSWERNDSADTPLLFILKYSADLFFAEISAYWELNDNVSLSTLINKRSVHKAIKLLKNLTEILEKYSMPTLAWIPDREGTVVISILLISIRLASYKLEPIGENDSFLYNTHKLRLLLVELLRTVLRDAKPSDMKRQNGRSEGFLHALLNMGVNNKHVIVEEAEMLQSLEILLKHKVDVNVVDSRGSTPLDVTYELQEKGPNLYKKFYFILFYFYFIRFAN